MATFKNNTLGEENAIEGTAVDGRGVVGISTSDYGMRAHSVKLSGIRASSDEGPGVEGGSKNSIGVIGSSDTNEGVRGISHSAHGAVVGVNDFAPADPPGAGGNGGWFESAQGEGVRGWSKTIHHGGVVGVNTAGGFAVYGLSDDGNGVVGESKNNIGVWATSTNHEAVHAVTQSATTAAMAVYMTNAASLMPALHVEHAGKTWAAHFVGNVIVTDGDITLANADCAEDFDISENSCAEPGTVMVLDDESKLRESTRPYDKRVAGVISGAGHYKPGLVLDKQSSVGNRQPIALLGKVYCKVDAQFGPIEVGDLLTTSPTTGHAMRADDPFKAFGAVIGKALRPLPDGQGLIPILIALQ